MKIFAAALLLLTLVSIPSNAETTRRYYIAAEEVTWDYAPSGMDLLYNRVVPQPWGANTKWPKSRFIEYTDSTFSTRKPQPEWLGILGPMIRAEVGDTIVVEFWNRTHMWHSIHPHGLRYDKASEGAYYIPNTSGRVPPGGRYTYRWFADEGSGPGKDDSSSVVWWYHGHANESPETNAGLLGPIIITAKGKARPDGSPKDVDRELVALFMIFDQLNGKNAGLFHTINGYIFGNLPGLIMKQGERVRWYLLAMGNERDLHTPHWHGKTVEYRNHHTDVVELLPASMVTVDMLADNPGTWLFHCQVSDHMESGMMAVYTIYQPETCHSPLQFLSADPWQTPGKLPVIVKNTGTKPIQSMIVTYDLLMSPYYRRRPFDNSWNLSKPIQPGQSETFEMPGWLPAYADKVAGLVLFPKKITYSDGSTYQPADENECFSVFWRDKDHPHIEVLPPLQVEMNED